MVPPSNKKTKRSATLVNESSLLKDNDEDHHSLSRIAEHNQQLSLQSINVAPANSYDSSKENGSFYVGTASSTSDNENCKVQPSQNSGRNYLVSQENDNTENANQSASSLSLTEKHLVAPTSNDTYTSRSGNENEPAGNKIPRQIMLVHIWLLMMVSQTAQIFGVWDTLKRRIKIQEKSNNKDNGIADDSGFSNLLQSVFDVPLHPTGDVSDNEYEQSNTPADFSASTQTLSPNSSSKTQTKFFVPNTIAEKRKTPSSYFKAKKIAYSGNNRLNKNTLMTWKDKYNTNNQNIPCNSRSLVEDDKMDVTLNAKSTTLKSLGISLPELNDLERKQHRMKYLCAYPVHPHMRKEDERFKTFQNVWPQHLIHTEAKSYANAGFCFIDKGSRLRCWYCNVGITDWKPGDDAFEFHAKWSPGCEHLLITKGENYVSVVQTHYFQKSHRDETRKGVDIPSPSNFGTVAPPSSVSSSLALNPPAISNIPSSLSPSSSLQTSSKLSSSPSHLTIDNSRSVVENIHSSTSEEHLQQQFLSDQFHPAEPTLSRTENRACTLKEHSASDICANLTTCSDIDCQVNKNIPTPEPRFEPLQNENEFMSNESSSH